MIVDVDVDVAHSFICSHDVIPKGSKKLAGIPLPFLHQPKKYFMDHGVKVSEQHCNRKRSRHCSCPSQHAACQHCVLVLLLHPALRCCAPIASSCSCCMLLVISARSKEMAASNGDELLVEKKELSSRKL